MTKPSMNTQKKQTNTETTTRRTITIIIIIRKTTKEKVKTLAITWKFNHNFLSYGKKSSIDKQKKKKNNGANFVKHLVNRSL